jgi:hypothetical protein
MMNCQWSVPESDRVANKVEGCHIHDHTIASFVRSFRQTLLCPLSRAVCWLFASLAVRQSGAKCLLHAYCETHVGLTWVLLPPMNFVICMQAAECLPRNGGGPCAC